MSNAERAKVAALVRSGKIPRREKGKEPKQ